METPRAQTEQHQVIEAHHPFRANRQKHEGMRAENARRRKEPNWPCSFGNCRGSTEASSTTSMRRAQKKRPEDRPF